ncbi:MAG: PSD1 domain-containing protein [Planctomycetaceae bacterium]|nr:PSD1 domain-containing protein [Planctomycetaceae bacterium]
MADSIRSRNAGSSRGKLCATLYARWSIALMLVWLVPGWARSTRADDLDKLDFFEKSVRPLLFEACGDCHGAKKQWAGLRLDRFESLLQGGDSGPALIPGKPDESLLIAAVRRLGDIAMPPEHPLTAAEVAILEQWVRDGAVWPKEDPAVDFATKAKTHWAFQPLSYPVPPALSDPWCKTPVDQFILAKLHEHQLAPAPPADRRTLIRRVTYDLTGLPPTPGEVEAFVNDPVPDAYERLIERLLESPHYGEHWARHWLDVARYSDTKGYVYAREERFLVQAPWYRDWVVRAFQQDLPYNRFLLLQLAADQVAPEDPAQLAAMGFLTIGRRFLGVTHDIIDDRIDVVSRGTMGLTVGCARCHNHKYDPIPTADYYSLYGVFQNCTEQLLQIGAPTSQDDSQAAFTAELSKRQQALAEKLAASRAEASERARNRIVDYLVAQTELEKYPEEGFDQILAPTDLVPAFVRRWQGYLATAGESGDRIFLPWHRFAAIPPTEFAEQSPRVCAEFATLDASLLHPALRELWSPPPLSMGEVAERYGKLFVQVHEEWKQLIAEKEGAAPERFENAEREELRQILYGPRSPVMVPDEAIVTTEYYFDSGTVTALWKLQGEVDRWLIQSSQAPPFAVAVVDRGLISEPRIFKRGNPLMRGEVVPRQFLSVVAGEARQPFRQGSGRLELAQAIVAPTNPLTTRVWVNRVWLHHFGAGLVTTPSDFGVRASPPSHPELLDWLSRYFQEKGWSTKELHRLILLSATYQQESRVDRSLPTSAKGLQIDPENRLLWRMNPHRLSFEELRDTWLAVSDDLDTRTGGRARDLFAPNNRRRTLYGLIDRQFLPGVLRVFDFANPDLHIPQRSETTIPQQALFALNHSFLASRAKAIIAKLPDDTDEARLEQLYRRVWQRKPTPAQRQAALAYLQTDAETVPSDSPESADWQYGYGVMDPVGKSLTNFTLLPHFTGTAWQGGENWPDKQLGWAQLTAEGGHPGNDLNHAVVRRWTAPRAMQITIRSTIIHEPDAGDGIRCWILSSRAGALKSLVIHRKRESCDLERLDVAQGEALDFIVDIHANLNSDQYLWAMDIQEISPSPTEHGAHWNSERDFRGPPRMFLTPWEQLAQVLLMANETVFID